MWPAGLPSEEQQRGLARRGRGQSGGGTSAARPTSLTFPQNRGGLGRSRLWATGPDPMSHNDRHMSQAPPRAGLGHVSESLVQSALAPGEARGPAARGTELPWLYK